MVMSIKKKKPNREWSTPLEESSQATTQFAQSLVVSLSILNLIRQLEELEAQGVTIDEAYKQNLILSLANDVPVGQA